MRLTGYKTLHSARLRQEIRRDKRGPQDAANRIEGRSSVALCTGRLAGHQKCQQWEWRVGYTSTFQATSRSGKHGKREDGTPRKQEGWTTLKEAGRFRWGLA